MLLTIVTVTKSPAIGFEETYTSVLREFGEYDDVEYLIKDWDATSEWAESSSPAENALGLRIRRVKGKDSGVFDAMNQSIEAARGTWMLFLNAGDWFANGFAKHLLAAIQERSVREFLYFDGVTVDHGDRREFLRKAPAILDLSHFYYHAPILHPCLVVRRAKLAQNNFDLNYDLAADFDLMVRLVSDSSVGTHVSEPGAFILSGGLSEQQRIRARFQATRSLWKHRRSLVEGLRIGFAFVQFLVLHCIIVGLIHKVPMLQRGARKHTGGQSAGTYS
ncbi:MAG: glycosyltransferase [Opitutaceae bacterium]